MDISKGMLAIFWKFFRINKSFYYSGPILDGKIDICLKKRGNTIWTANCLFFYHESALKKFKFFEIILFEYLIKCLMI